jgi:hypothetical protein
LENSYEESRESLSAKPRSSALAKRPTPPAGFLCTAEAGNGTSQMIMVDGGIVYRVTATSAKSS